MERLALSYNSDGEAFMSNDTGGGYVLYADAQATIAALQAQVRELEDGTTALLNQQSERLAVENEKLTMALSQLTQRTAELEAIETILDIDSGKTTVEKVRDLHRAFKQVWESYQDASNEMFKAQAELERVRLLSSHNERRFEMLEEKYKELRTLVLALPKVEGEYLTKEYIEVKVPVLRGTARLSISDELIALLQHRQGMEG